MLKNNEQTRKGDAMRKQKIVFTLHRETKLPWKLIKEMPSQGRADDYIEWVKSAYIVQSNLVDSIECLKSFGAWDESELQDLDSNLDRLLWIALLDCKEQKTNYWYMST